MNTKTKREVLAGIGAINDELVRVLDNSLVTIPRDVPHNDLVAFFDQLAAKLDITRGDAPHVHQRCLPTDDFGDERPNEAVVCF